MSTARALPVGTLERLGVAGTGRYGYGRVVVLMVTSTLDTYDARLIRSAPRCRIWSAPLFIPSADTISIARSCWS